MLGFATLYPTYELPFSWFVAAQAMGVYMKVFLSTPTLVTLSSFVMVVALKT
jgi:hypothetical protein